MNSDQLLSSYNIPEYTQPSQIQMDYTSSQSPNYQSVPYITPIPEDYQTTNSTNNQIENINYADITYSTPSTQINQIPITNVAEEYNINQLSNNVNQINSYEAYPATNYKATSSNYEQPTNYQLDYNSYNNEVNINTNIENVGNQINTNSYNENIQINSSGNIFPSNLANQGSQINLESLNQIQEKTEKIESPFNQLASTITVNENINQEIQEPKLISTDLNKSLPPTQIDEKKISSPKLVNPLETKIPKSPSIPSMHSMHSEDEIKLENVKESDDSIFKEEQNKNLTKDEENLLRNEKEKEFNRKDLDVKSHFDLTLTKDENAFFYQKVHKVSTPLLAHYEMPENLEYKYPILSPDGKYLACIGKGDEDSVFVWDVSDLYWYKYKFSYSNVDIISFTPNSKSIIIVYSTSNPIMYDLSSGKMQLEFEKDEEDENNRKILQCAYTNSNTHFALTTTNSYTLWSLRTGKIKQKILDKSPIKIISILYGV